MSSSCETAAQRGRRMLRQSGYKIGGRVKGQKAEKALVIKGIREHENAEHGGRHEPLKLKRGGEVHGEKTEPRPDRRAMGGETMPHRTGPKVGGKGKIGTVNIKVGGDNPAKTQQAMEAGRQQGMQMGARLGAQAAAQRMGGAGGPGGAPGMPPRPMPPGGLPTAGPPGMPPGGPPGAPPGAMPPRPMPPGIKRGGEIKRDVGGAMPVPPQQYSAAMPPPQPRPMVNGAPVPPPGMAPRMPSGPMGGMGAYPNGLKRGGAMKECG